MATHRVNLLAVALLATLMGGLVGNTARAQPVKLSADELNRRALERRAVEAAIWGMPIVNFDAMRQAFFRDAKAGYGDIMFWSKPGRWKNQCLTPNTTVRYVFSFINTSKAGPVVVELPPTGDAALLGTILDAWQVPLMDLGSAGEDQQPHRPWPASRTRRRRQYCRCHIRWRAGHARAVQL